MSTLSSTVTITTSSPFFASDHLEHLSLGLAGALLLYVVSGFTYRHFLRPAKQLKQRYGQYAVVTGATDGIGKAIALELAKSHKLNLILISRTASKLQEVAAEISQKYSTVDVLTVAVDFANVQPKDLESVRSLVQKHDVGVLVNNVGLSYDYPEWFHSLSSDKVRELINLNVTSTTAMTHLVLPGMVERKRGCIVNLSSAASLIPSPLLAEYGAAKAYVDKLTVALAVEYKAKGIDIQVQNPLYVATKMAKMRPSLQTPTANQFARVSVKAFGYDTQLSPYWVHALMLAVVKRLPSFVSHPYIMGMHKSIRARAMKKASLQKKQ